jgi:hypothetical protein
MDLVHYVAEQFPQWCAALLVRMDECNRGVCEMCGGALSRQLSLGQMATVATSVLLDGRGPDRQSWHQIGKNPLLIEQPGPVDWKVCRPSFAGLVAQADHVRLRGGVDSQESGDCSGQKIWHAHGYFSSLPSNRLTRSSTLLTLNAVAG